MDAMPIKTEEMTHRIGRFYTGQPSWRTRLRSLRRRLGDGSLPLSEEEHLIKVKQQLLAENRDAGDCEDSIHALRLVWRLPRVMLAADGQTTFRYVKALKNASTTIINLLLEMTGEAAYRSWDAKDHLMRLSAERRVKIQGKKGQVSVGVNEYRPRLHRYMQEAVFAPEPYADIRFCVVRDPVERFLSGLNQGQIEVLRSGRKLPSLTGAFIDEWLDTMAAVHATKASASPAQRNAETKDRATKRTKKHLLRQTYFLGTDASWYTHIFSTRRPQEFHDFLSDLAGKRLSPFDANSLASRQRVLSARGFSLERPQLTAAQRRRVEDLYAEDYRVFGRWF